MKSPSPFVWLATVAWMVTLAAGALADLSFAADVREWIGLFNGKDLKGWRFQEPAQNSQWTVGTAALDPQDPR
ncbi:MAG: hypothetical protein FJ276_34195 [Planctomycetes bacterium]|nr:hypothetical protein [Planctomycetota bacterium]